MSPISMHVHVWPHIYSGRLVTATTTSAMCVDVGSLTQVYTSTSTLDPLPANPDRAFMTATPFSAQESDQPKSGSFVLRMLGVFYHAGGSTTVAVSGAPAGAKAFVAVDGVMLATGTFNKPEGNHQLDVRRATPALLMPRGMQVAKLAHHID